MEKSYGITTYYTVEVKNDQNESRLLVEQWDDLPESAAVDTKSMVSYVRELSKKYCNPPLSMVSIHQHPAFKIHTLTEDSEETVEYSFWSKQAQQRSKTREILLRNKTQGMVETWTEVINK